MFDWLFGKRPAGKAREGGTVAFPHPLETVTGEEAFEAFEKLLRAARGAPVILGDDNALSMIADGIARSRKQGHTVESILRKAAAAPFPGTMRAEMAAWVAKTKKEDPDWPEEENEPQMGEWPSELPQLTATEPRVPFNVTTYMPHERVHIALIPTSDRTEIPAYLHWGGWNACPEPHHHVAAARHWRDTYGAELISMASDVVEYRVARRPKDRAEATALAHEHHDYCGETEELLPYAAELLVLDWWYFWWD
jgi:hypothetical protein